MHRHRSVLTFCALLALSFACSDDPTAPQGPFQLTFEGDASFQGAHGTQAIYVAVVRTSDGEVVARASGTVSGTADPAFSFSFADALERGSAYQLHYWIDSNFGGGTVGACDPKAMDHQWSVAIAQVTADVTVTEAHNPGATTDVCQSFSATLTFSGDATFQGAHGGQMVSVGLVRSSDGLVVARQSGTVSATANPSFSFTFTGQLVVAEQYQVHYWIDSNFGGGTMDVCDPPSTDHQWSVNTGPVSGDLMLTEVHTPAAVTDVCATFP